MGIHTMAARGLVLLLALAAVTVDAAKIHDHIRDGDLAGVKKEIENGADVNIKSAQNQSPVMHAVLDGQDDIVEYLLTVKGVDLSITDAPAGKPSTEGYSPLHGAAFKGRYNCARMLIAAGQDPDLKHDDGFTPLHRATWGSNEEHTKTVQVMLDFGARADMLADDGTNALNMAREAKNDATVAILQEYLEKKGTSKDYIERMLRVQSPDPQAMNDMMQKMASDPSFMDTMQKLAGAFGGDTGKFKETLMKEAGNMKPGSSPDQLKDALKNMAEKYAGSGGGHTEL